MRRRTKRHVDNALEAILRRTRAQLEVIGHVGQAETLLSGEVELAARQITELAAGVVGCERVNVWLFNDDETELRCIDLFEASTGRHSAGTVLHEHEYGPEFQAIKSSRYVNADNPVTDPRTAGYVDTYLKPLGITSMLDAVIHASGQNFGLLCFEHVNTPHHWEQDEIRFACQLADKLGLALLSRARRRAEEQVRATAAALGEAQALARVGSWELDIQANVLTWSDETYRIFGVSRDTFTPSYEALLARIHPDDRAMVHARYMAAVTTRTVAAIDHRIVLDDGRIVFVHERGRTFYNDSGRAIRSVGTVQDVTERRLFEGALEARDGILHAVMLSAAGLVSGSSLAEAMPKALEVVARAIGVDRVMVLKKRARAEGGPVLEYAWQAPGVPRVADYALRGWDRPEITACFEPLDAGAVVMTTARAAGPEMSAMMAAMHSQSLLCVPIVFNEETWGCIGVDDCRAERIWSSTELDALGTLARVIGSLVMRETALSELRRSEERFRAVTEAAQDAIVLTDAQGTVRYWNRAAERILGYTAGEVLGTSLYERLLGGPMRGRLEGGLDALAAAGAHGGAAGTVQLTAVRKDGVGIPIELSVATMELGAERHAVGILRDITERKQAEARILEMARVDSLTGLANRRVFAEAIKQAIGRANRGGRAFAVLYLDLDQFKDVNDTLGHPVGDLLLRAVADRLRACIRDTDTVARFGGDEFAVLQTDLHDQKDAGVLASTLIEILGRPYLISGNELRSGASIGVTLYGPDGEDAEALLSHADIALYRAKSEGRGTCRFFTEAMGSDVRTRVALAAQLREAIDGGQLFLMFQPQVHVRTGRIVGVEALVRWAHPTRGVVQPAEFIPAAERTGLVVPLGRWVIGEACRQARAWLDEGVGPDVIAVNLSAVQLKAPLALERDIADALAESRLPPERLEIELTETAVMDSSREHSDVLRRLRSSRVRLALDDFGTGYSSLEYLHRFPVDRIKIAQSFVLGLGTVAGDAAIVKAALGLARELGLSVIAEGVETERQLRLLREWGCLEVQGYYFAPPLSADAMGALLRTGRFPVPEDAFELADAEYVRLR
jgi:diguanylate cyclase (GGDEF)-like protein/PAS domain S-box-containing protein